MSGNFRGASTLICLKLKGIKKDKLLFEIFVWNLPFLCVKTEFLCAFTFYPYIKNFFKSLNLVVVLKLTSVVHY